MGKISFDLKQILEKYTALRKPRQRVYYHYTSLEGFTGILHAGGLRACPRILMNDNQEFDYAHDLLLKTIDDTVTTTFASVNVKQILGYLKYNLEKILKKQTEYTSAYCACMTSNRDKKNLWLSYADNGQGVALGYDVIAFLQDNIQKVKDKEPFIYCNEVIYNKGKQREIIQELIRCGIHHIAFSQASTERQLHQFTRAVLVNLVTYLFCIMPSLKDARFAEEEELRFFLDFNDGRLELAEKNKKYYERPSGIYIPFIQLDFSISQTGRMPIKEIIIGSNASFDKTLCCVEQILDKYEYGKSFNDRPEVIRSQVIL